MNAGNPRGLTLLEVVLALAILAGALAVLGELVRMGSHAAMVARQTTQAQLLCQGLLAELSAGLRPAAVVPLSQFEEDPDWLYEIDLQQLDTPGLLAVRVTVVENVPHLDRAVEFSLVRWLPDPGVDWVELDPESAAVAGGPL